MSKRENSAKYLCDIRLMMAGRSVDLAFIQFLPWI